MSKVKRKKKHQKKIRLAKEFGWLCYYCNKELDESTATLDHIDPLSKGGEDHILNCVLACVDCNHKKADISPLLFKKRMDYLQSLRLVPIRSN